MKNVYLYIFYTATFRTLTMHSIVIVIVLLIFVTIANGNDEDSMQLKSEPDTAGDSVITFDNAYEYMFTDNLRHLQRMEDALNHNLHSIKRVALAIGNEHTNTTNKMWDFYALYYELVDSTSQITNNVDRVIRNCAEVVQETEKRLKNYKSIEQAFNRAVSEEYKRIFSAIPEGVKIKDL